MELLAPNGRPSNLTPEQYRLVRTPEFKKFFGDWEKLAYAKLKDPAMDEITLNHLSKDVSKIVDENGEPLVVYHGTTKKFNEFDRSKGFYEGWYGLGFYFTDNLEDINKNYTSKGYDLKQKIKVLSKQTKTSIKEIKKNIIDDDYLLTCFLKIINPIKIFDKIGLENSKKILKVEQKLIEYGYDVEGLTNYIKSKIGDLSQKNYWELENTIRNLSIPFEKNENIVGEVIRLMYELIGFDGIIMNPYTIFNTYENRGMDVDEKTVHFISFYSKNIKLADGTNTTFDGSNPDIRYNGGGNIKKPKFIIEENEDEDRIEISLKNIGKVILAVTYPRYEFSEDVGEDGLNELGIDEDDEIGKIEHIEIEDEYKGKGYAKILMNKAIEIAKERGLMPLYLNASPMGFRGLKLDDLTAFYESFGFEVFLSQGNNNLMILKDKYKKGGRVRLSKTPAPKSERIYGSSMNKPKSSSSSSSASSITFSEDTLEKIKNKISQHNEKHPNKKVSLAVAKAVVRRGMGAYSSTHRPTIKGGKPNSRVAWGLARLNAFLYKIVHGTSKSGRYSQDNDLISELGYRVSKYNNGGEILLAPNGNPSNLTPEQYRLVRTPEFKAWFGDWENNPNKNMLLENGEPMVLWRGDRDDFNIFDIDKTGSKRFFFTPSEEYAKFRGEVVKSYFVKSDIIYRENSAMARHEFMPESKYLYPLLITPPVGSPYNEIIAFNPNQIKLADGTNTTFDTNNPDIRFKKGGSVLLAPNGKPSKLTPEQYRLVRTPEFKAWFGDWEKAYETGNYDNVSKVIDEETKEPLVVYHGTIKDFSIFSFDKLGSGIKANLGYLGIYFTDDKTLATDFTRIKWTNPNSKFKKGSKVYEVFLKIKNPKYMTIDGFILMDNKNRSEESIKNVRKDLLKKGYDGIIVEKAELYWQSRMREFDGKQYVILENNKNIKLADGSNTTFDSNNPDIRYKDGGKVGNKKYECIISVKAINIESAENKCLKYMPNFCHTPIKFIKGQYNLETTLYFNSEEELFNYFKKLKNKGIDIFHYEEKNNDSNNDDIRYKKGGNVRKKISSGGGDCYYVAGQFAMGVLSPEKIDYKGTPYIVHAEVQGQGHISHIRYGHAWVEDDENVYDFSNNRKIIFPKQLYYVIGDVKTDNPKKYRKYTFQEARRKMVETKHYGCWDLDVEYSKGGYVLLAPNGQPSNLTPEQHKLVRTPEFKAWFGDWEKAYETGNYDNVSKVIDEETKEPLVVYRGSRASTQNVSGLWLSKSKSYAEGFGDIMQYFVKIIKPMPEYLFNKTWMVDYDLYDGRLGDFHKIVVKYPNQIKLADGTNTTFDSNNPDIRYTDGGQTPPYVSDDFQIGYNGAYEHLIAPNFEHTLKQLYPNIFLLEMDSQYDLATTFAKVQAFYEWDNFRGKKFNIDEFYTWYSINKPELKPYAEEFYGFNVPSNEIKECYRINTERTPYDKFLLYIIAQIKSKYKSNNFYLIGAVKGDSVTLKHEMAHAFFWADPLYKQDMTRLVNEIENKDELLEILATQRGYGKNVLMDEAQAFLSTGLIVEISAWENHRQPFIERFNQKLLKK